jgi:murein DD-endopeptidase MepM/ murein hydrolase activator NlpD
LRHVDIVVAPDGATSIRRFRLSRIALYLICFAALLVVSGLSLSLKVGLDAARHRGRSAQLENENNILRRRLNDLSVMVADLKSTLEENMGFEKQARLLAGLEPISEDVRRMGVGGPDLTVPDDLEVAEDGTALTLRAYSNRLDEMKRQAELQKRSYTEILERLSSQKDLLRHTPSIGPVAGGYVTSTFGARTDPFTGNSSFHEGVDFCAARGTPVRATADGRVVFSGVDREYGYTLRIDHGRGVETRYSHNQKLLAKQGVEVHRGETIALVGNSGRSTGPHVHYEIRIDGRTVNPLRYVLPDDIMVD